MDLKKFFLVLSIILIIIFIWLWQVQTKNLKNMQTHLTLTQTKYAQIRDNLNKADDINNRQKTELNQIKNRNEELSKDLLNRVEKQSQLEASIMGAEKLLAASREELKITKNSLKELQIIFSETSKKNIELNTELNKYKTEFLKNNESTTTNINATPCTASEEEVKKHALLTETANLKLEITKAKAELNYLNNKITEDYNKLIKIKKEIALETLNNKELSSLNNILKNLTEQLSLQVKEEEIILSQKNNIIKIILNNNLIFSEGSANLSPEGQRILNLINQAFDNSKIEDLTVINYSGNKLAQNEYRNIYPSKWEFSSAMAGNLTSKLKQLENFKDNKITAISKADNETNELSYINNEYTEIIIQISNN